MPKARKYKNSLPESSNCKLRGKSHKSKRNSFKNESSKNKNDSLKNLKKSHNSKITTSENSTHSNNKISPKPALSNSKSLKITKLNYKNYKKKINISATRSVNSKKSTQPWFLKWKNLKILSTGKQPKCKGFNSKEKKPNKHTQSKFYRWNKNCKSWNCFMRLAWIKSLNWAIQSQVCRASWRRQSWWKSK